jgi:hypothetical protein
MQTVTAVPHEPSALGLTQGHRPSPLLLIPPVILVILAIVYRHELGTWAAGLWSWMPLPGSGRTLRWLVALLPASIIVNHMVYLMSSRRKQFREALGTMDAGKLLRLEDLYFGYGPMTIRYLLPAILVTLLSSTAIAALTNPEVYIQWLYERSIVLVGESPISLEVAARWPSGWGAEALRGAALGFIGAYVYLLLLLTDRARQRDITAGIAIWAATMPVLGPLMGGVAALLLVSGAGLPEGSSFTRDAVFFVAGMLPRQFATFVQTGVSKMFQSGATVTVRTLPLATLRGVGPNVESRLEEEGIHDVSALAYASPHQLMRATTYAPRQIVDWIDEALLIATVPSHWELLEKSGVTGAMDLAWYETQPESIVSLANEIKMPEPLLRAVVTRLAQDAQVGDLYQLYWDHSDRRSPLAGLSTSRPDGGAPPGVSLAYTFIPGIGPEARDRLVADTKAMNGVLSVTVEGDNLTVVVAPVEQARIVKWLSANTEVGPRG